jgi:hypothetical protein
VEGDRKVKSEAIFGYFLVAALLVLVFFINTGISTTLLEQKDEWGFTQTTREMNPRPLVGSDTGYNLTAGQRLLVSWSGDPYGWPMNPADSMRFYLLNSSQIGGFLWEWHYYLWIFYVGQWETAYDGYLIKQDSWNTTIDCLINSTGTYYVIFCCEGDYNIVDPIISYPAINVISYAAYAVSPLQANITPSTVAIDFGQSQLFTSTVSGGTSPYSYQWYLYSGAVLGNTVVNPGFETGNSTGWNQEGPNNASIRSDINHTGSYCCASPYIGSQYLPFKITQKLPSVSSNLVTNVSCWYKWGNPTLDWLRVNYTDGSVSSKGLGSIADWTYVTLNLAANKTVDSLILERNASYMNIICIDDVKFSVSGFPVSGATGPTWTFTPSSLGSYTVYVQVTDNAGFTVNSNFATVTVNPVLSVTISPSSVVMDVDQSQLFTSTVSGGTSPYSYQWYLNDAPVSGATDANWTFISSSAGSYAVYVNATDNVGVQATSNIAIVTVKFHDVAVTNVASSKTVVGQGFSATINVTVANQGGQTETFNVTAYANATVIGLENVTLTAGSSATVTFTWDTTGFTKGNYTISAYAWPVPGETNTVDNTFVDGWVVVTSHGWELDFTVPTNHPIVDFAVYNGSLYAAADNKLCEGWKQLEGHRRAYFCNLT